MWNLWGLLQLLGCVTPLSLKLPGTIITLYSVVKLQLGFAPRVADGFDELEDMTVTPTTERLLLFSWTLARFQLLQPQAELEGTMHVTT